MKIDFKNINYDFIILNIHVNYEFRGLDHNLHRINTKSLYRMINDSKCKKLYFINFSKRATISLDNIEKIVNTMISVNYINIDSYYILHHNNRYPF